MRLSAHLAAAWAAGFAAATRTTPMECKNPNLSFNATNIAALVNCTHTTYMCSYELFTFDTTAGDVPFTNCTQAIFKQYVSDASFNGSLVIPGLLEVKQSSFDGYWPWWLRDPAAIESAARFLDMTSIDMPDLVNITENGIFISYADKLSSLKLPKLKNIRGPMVIDLSRGPAINMSFPSLYSTSTIHLAGKIDALEFPALNNTNLVNVTSTGDLDCEAFAASVVNATELYHYGFNYRRDHDRVICNSNRASVTTGWRAPTSTNAAGRTGGPGVRGDLLLLAVLVSYASWVFNY